MDREHRPQSALMALLQDFKVCLLHPWRQRIGLETQSSWKASVPLSLKAFQPGFSQQEHRAAISCCSNPATGKPDQALEVPVPDTSAALVRLVGVLSPTTARGGQQIFGASAPPLHTKGFGFPYLCGRAVLSSVKTLSRAQEFSLHQGCHNSNMSQLPWAQLQTTTHGQHK